MISLEDIIAMSGLDAQEIEAIAEHEHIPSILAATLADHLLHQVDGAERIRQMIVNDIDMAARSGDADRVAELSETLDHFLRQHPVHADVAH
jgi:predicted protein tyrosine phosphatase